MPSLNLADALNELAEQTDASLLFPYKDAQNRQSNPVKGHFSLIEALTIMLQGSGLSSSLSNDGVIKISPTRSKRPKKETEERKSMKKNKVSVGILAALGTIFGIGGNANSQEVEQQATEEDNIEQILVTGVRGSIINGLSQKRSSAGFVDAISAEDLGKFPDLNLSESIQRIPGVTLQRGRSGDGQSINLRGLGPEFTRVEINGVTGGSNSNNDAANPFGGGNTLVGAGFNFEILASELFSNITINKTQTAKQSEGGLAGLVQLETPKAFDRDGFNFSVSGQANVSDTADDVGPRGAILISNNWDDKFGITASVAYSDVEFQTNSIEGLSARPLSASATDDIQATPEQLAALVPNTINRTVDIDLRETIGTTAGLQYRPSEKVEISVDGIYATIDSDRTFTRVDGPPENGIFAVTNDIIEDGVFQQATLSNVQQRVGVQDNSFDEDFVQLSGKIEWTPNADWEITPFIGYSKRDIERVGGLFSYARGSLDTGLLTREDVTFRLQPPFIDFSTTGTDFSANANAEEFFLNVFLLRPTNDEDEEVSAKVDFTHYLDGALSRIDFGVRYSERELTRESSETRIDNASPDVDLRTLPSLADSLNIITDFNIDGAPAGTPNTIISADTRRILDLFLPNGFDFGSVANPISGPVGVVEIPGVTVPGAILQNFTENTALRTFSGEEETLALYVEGTFEIEDNININTGLRFITTDQTSTGSSISNGVATPVTVGNDYSEFLPSISLRYLPSSETVFRAAYSRTLTRPTLADLRVSEVFSGIDESGGQGSQGNPDLNPFTSDNIDIGFEWYFAEEGLLAVNLFHKNIDGLIISESFTADRTFISQVTSLPVTAPVTFVRPTNNPEEVEINGLELAAQGRFTFLPEGWLQNLGGIVNYTYTDSDDVFVEGDGEASGSGLPGLSENSFNTSLYYDDGIFDAKLSFAWRDRFLSNLNSAFGVPRFQNSFGQLDFSANYRISSAFTLQFQALNLNDEQLEEESIRNIPAVVAQLDRRLFFGLRYTY